MCNDGFCIKGFDWNSTERGSKFQPTFQHYGWISNATQSLESLIPTLGTCGEFVSILKWNDSNEYLQCLENQDNLEGTRKCFRSKIFLDKSSERPFSEKLYGILNSIIECLSCESEESPKYVIDIS